ncbi:MAG: hypothetical protein U0183_13705 [Polyangiaceae bacterium]
MVEARRTPEAPRRFVEALAARVSGRAEARAETRETGDVGARHGARVALEQPEEGLSERGLLGRG